MIKDEENIVRILSKDWFGNGKLLHIAFALRKGETYISVNRPAVETFDSDVASFVAQHPDYTFGETSNNYCAAKLNVGNVRGIKVELEGRTANIDFEVEPRDANIKSHAGIFTRCEGRNLKGNDTILMQENVPANDILLKVRMKLCQLSEIEFKRNA